MTDDQEFVVVCGQLVDVSRYWYPSGEFMMLCHMVSGQKFFADGDVFIKTDETSGTMPLCVNIDTGYVRYFLYDDLVELAGK